MMAGFLDDIIASLALFPFLLSPANKPTSTPKNAPTEAIAAVKELTSIFLNINALTRAKSIIAPTRAMLVVFGSFILFKGDNGCGKGSGGRNIGAPGIGSQSGGCEFGSRIYPVVEF